MQTYVAVYNFTPTTTNDDEVMLNVLGCQMTY